MSQSSNPERSRAEAANRLLEQNRLDEARSIYEELCRPGQQDVDLWLNLALVYRKSGSFEQASAACEQALLLRNDYALAHHIYGSVQQCLGHLAEAIGSYRRALELDPALAEAHYFLGNALQMTGKPEEAVKSYHSAIELRPDYLEALSNLGAVLMNLHRYDDALAPLQQASRLCPECEQILCNLGDLALARDDLDQAESLARSVLDINPEFFDAHILLGKIYRSKGDYDRVLEHYNNARVIRPGSEHILGSIAEVLEMRGEFDEARRMLGSLVEKGSVNPLVLRVFSALSSH
jgi:tetratricopeptide (TPR) repeat protein